MDNMPWTKAFVHHLEDSRLDDRSLRVYLRVRAYCWGNKKFCVAGQQKFADDLKMSLRSVEESVKKLKELGYLWTTRRGPGQTQKTWIVKPPYSTPGCGTNPHETAGLNPHETAGANTYKVLEEEKIKKDEEGRRRNASHSLPEEEEKEHCGLTERVQSIAQAASRRTEEAVQKRLAKQTSWKDVPKNELNASQLLKAFVYYSQAIAGVKIVPTGKEIGQMRNLAANSTPERIFDAMLYLFEHWDADYRAKFDGGLSVGVFVGCSRGIFELMDKGVPKTRTDAARERNRLRRETNEEEMDKQLKENKRGW